MTESSQLWQRVVLRAVLIERFDAVLYPIDLVTLIDRLPGEGWVTPEPVIDEQSLRIEPPVKGGVRLQVDQSNKTLGVWGRDLSETLDAYQQIRALSRELFEFPPAVRTDYVEFRYVGYLKGSGHPLETFERWWSAYERLDLLGRSLGNRLPTDANRLAPYGIRLAPSGLDANRPNWVELQITPLNTSGHSRYFFDLIFRNEESDVTENVVASADSIIEDAVSELERTS